jgi:hypothetical protein
MYSEELQFNIFLLLFTIGMLSAFGYGMKNDLKASIMVWIYLVVGFSSVLLSRLITVVML